MTSRTHTHASDTVFASGAASERKEAHAESAAQVRVSVCFGLGGRQQADLSVQEIPEIDCSLEIDAQTGSDDDIRLAFALKRRCEPANAKCEVDDASDGSSTGKDVGESDGNIVRVGNQAGPDLNRVLAHQGALQSMFDPESLHGARPGVQS